MNIKNKLKEKVNKFKKQKSSLKFKTLSYLVIFSLGIILFLWVFQILFLKISYEFYQVKQMQKIVNQVKNTEINSLNDELMLLAYQNGVCIEYESIYGKKLEFNTMMVGCGLDKNLVIVNDFKKEFRSSEESEKGIRLLNPITNAKAYLYAVNKDYGRVYIYSPLEDLNGASLILKSQLIYIMLIVLWFSIIFAYFISQKITKPITDITKKTREMGKGNYDVNFPKNGTLEIDELSKTLNLACKDMKKIDELRRDLLANVSHDLKTPLTMIKAYAEMVRDITYNDKEKREKNLNVIIEEADRLNVLVNDILELSKLQASSTELNIEEYDLISDIRLILEKYDIIRETENYTFILEGVSVALVKADRNKIYQVIYNLINNAINYTGKDKKVIVRVSLQEEFYLVEVIDTGKGIKASDLPYIWDRYYKNDKNHQRNVVGSGIGLSIVRNILEQHGFKYGVETKKNKGTNFYFKIPK